MLENFNKWIRQQKVMTKLRSKKSIEEEWGLYNATPKIFITWLFAFINQRGVGGHFNSQLTFGGGICENNCTIVINLNKAEASEDVIAHKMNHESLHCAIRNCLYNAPSKFSTIDTNFVEKVIDGWMLNKRIALRGYGGNAMVIEYGRSVIDYGSGI